MTARYGFDRVVDDWLASTAPQAEPDGLHEHVIDRARRSRQRPGWLASLRIGALGRHATPTSRAESRPVVALALVVLVLALVLIAVGVASRRPQPPPFGPAANGLLAFDSAGTIFIAQGDGTGVRALPSIGTTATSPAWSPDGQRLAFWSRDGQSGFRLSVVDRDGSETIQIPIEPTLTADPEVQPSWSPDGTRLVFAAGDHGIARLFTAELDQPGLIRLTSDSITALNPAWSPDGRWIAFIGVSTRALDDVGLFIVHPDGTGLQRLRTSTVPNQTLPRLSAQLEVPRWAPDPDRPALLYHFGADDDYDIAVFDLIAGRETIVSSDRANEFWPTWSPDGTRVAWYGMDRGRDAIRVASLDRAYRPVAVRSVLIAPQRAPGEGPNCRDFPSQVGRFVCTPPVWSPDGASIYGLDVMGSTILIFDVDGSAPPTRLSLVTGSGGAVSWQRVAP